MQQEKEALQMKYVNEREWHQITPNYGYWTYPHKYYSELVSLVLKHSK